MPQLSRLSPGTRFRLAEMPEVTGVLVTASEWRAIVRLDRAVREVEFVDQEGQPRRFESRGTHLTSWAPTTVVEPVGFEPLEKEENDMSKSATNKVKSTKAIGRKAKAIEKTLSNHPALGLVTKEPKASRKPKASKPAKAGSGKLSCIDAAAKVLGDSKEPMTTKAMIEAMASKGLWTSLGGKGASWNRNAYW